MVSYPPNFITGLFLYCSMLTGTLYQSMEGFNIETSDIFCL